MGKRGSGTSCICGILVAIGAPTGISLGANLELEEIIVVAQKREESLQTVPIAVSAFSAEALRKARIFDIADIASRTPSFTFQQFHALENELNIRGIGTVRLDSASADSSVAVFVDEVYIGRRGAATMDFYDLQRIEVLRGPQGTLYGKNVVGGALNILSASPEFDKSAQFRLGYGNYNSQLANAYVTGALGDSVAGRASFQYRSHDGYADNIVLNQELEDLDAISGRGQLLFNLADNLQLHLRGDISHDESNGQSRHAVDDPNVDGIGAVSAAITNNIRETEAPNSQFHDRDVWGVSANLKWDLSFGSLTSITAWRNADAANRLDQIGAREPATIVESAVTETEDYGAFSQEFRIATDQDARLDWLVGLYYLREETDRTDGHVATSSLFDLLGPGSVGDLLNGEYVYIQNNVTTNYAVFGQLGFRFSDDLKLTLGGRYTIDQKDYETQGVDLSNDNGTIPLTPLLTPFSTVRSDEDWSKFTPRLALSWSATDDALIYGSVSNGFKGGGWQGKPGSASGAAISYDPESAWNYELGAKTDWLGGRLRTNIAVFYIDYQDLQVEQLNDTCLCLVVDNAADAKSRGIELELQWVPTDNLFLWLTGSYLDTEYENFVDSQGNDFSGNQLQRAPENQYNVGAEYLVPIQGEGDLSLRFDYTWQDTMFWSPSPTNREEAYGLLDARLSFKSENDRWELAAWGKNLGDEEYRTSIISFLGDELSLFAPPRTYGLEFLYYVN